MKFKHISTRFIVAFVGTLAAVFLLFFVTLFVTIPVTMNNHIKKNILAVQDELDASVAEVINESAYLYARFMQSSNAQTLNILGDEQLPYATRRAAFLQMVEKSGMNSNYFADVTLLVGEQRFSVHGGVSGNIDIQAFTQKKNSLMYVGNDNGNLVMGVNSAGYYGFSGIFLFSMAEGKIDEMVNPVSGEEGYSFLMRSDGYIISHTDKNLVGKYIVYSDVYSSSEADYKRVTLDGKRCIVVTGSAQQLNSRYGFDCVVISVLDYTYYFGRTRITLAVLTSISAVALAVAVVLAVVRARKISHPIALLSDKINSTAQLDSVPLPVLDEGDELAQLERNYDAMLRRIFDLVEKQKDDLQLQRKLELESLQMQINPHFLYNTLDAISWMAKIKKQPEIDKLVMNLAKFFRLFLHNGDKFVTVNEEVEMVKSYLAIEQIRRPGKGTFSYEISGEAENKKVLKLILQPLIENCLKHAFISKDGNLVVRAYIKDDDLYFQVQDDGVGFDVPDDILSHQPQKEGGYGLVNVHERLALQYGEGYGLTVTSQKGKGTTVTAKLKCEE